MTNSAPLDQPIVAVALYSSAKALKGVCCCQHIGALKQAGNSRQPDGNRTQHQSAVGNRFIPRGAKPAAQGVRAGGARECQDRSLSMAKGCCRVIIVLSSTTRSFLTRKGFLSFKRIFVLTGPADHGNWRSGCFFIKRYFWERPP